MSALNVKGYVEMSSLRENRTFFAWIQQICTCHLSRDYRPNIRDLVTNFISAGSNDDKVVMIQINFRNVA